MTQQTREPTIEQVHARATQVAARFRDTVPREAREDIANDVALKWWLMPEEEQDAIVNWRGYVSVMTSNKCRSYYTGTKRREEIIREQGGYRASAPEPGDRNEDRRWSASEGSVYQEGEEDALGSLILEEWLEEHGRILAQLSHLDRVVLAVRTQIYLGELDKEDGPAVASEKAGKVPPWNDNGFQIAVNRAQERLVELLAAADPSWAAVWHRDMMVLYGKRAVGYLKRTVDTEKAKKKPKAIPSAPVRGAGAVWFLACGKELDPAARRPVATAVAGRLLSEAMLAGATEDLFHNLAVAQVGEPMDDKILAGYVLDNWPPPRQANAAWKKTHA